MSSYITISSIMKNKNTLNTFVTALENFCVPHLRAVVEAFYMMVVPLSWYAIIVVRSAWVLMPCHRLVAAFTRRITPMWGTMCDGMRYLTWDVIAPTLTGWIITASTCSPAPFLQRLERCEEAGKGG